MMSKVVFGKKSLCVLLVISMVLMCFLTAPIASAATVNSNKGGASVDYNNSGADNNLQDNPQDGVILHAWNWSCNTIKSKLSEIAAAGYSTVQTSPLQQPKDFGGYGDVDGQWWKLYQPVSFSIARNSWIGNASDLSSLCNEAHKYGIKVIVDVVANHTANDGGSTSIPWELNNYESTIYNNYNQYFHQYADCNDGSIYNVVRGNIGEPDLNTGDSYIQGRVLSLLKEYVDCGVDGFRFDAAKHIETPDDGQYASDFWPTVLNGAQSYASGKNGKELYYYGEILNTVGTGRNVTSYTKYMSVTDNTTGNNIRNEVRNGNASKAAASKYNLGADASKTVLWSESHDTYEEGSSNYVNESDLNKTWALVGARKDATALYFSRPGYGSMGECNTYEWKSSQVSAVNKFHNAFVGQSESVSSDGSIAYVERGTTGIVLVNTKGTNQNVDVAVKQMSSGTYNDLITGNSFTVTNGKICGQIGSTGIAVVYSENVLPAKPVNSISQKGGDFTTDTVSVTLGLNNATSGTYQIDNGAVNNYSGSVTVTLGNGINFGQSTTIKLTATNGTETTNASYTFNKVEKYTGGVVIGFDNSGFNFNDVYVYVYDQTNGLVENSSWPGVKMTQESDGLYYYQVDEALENGKVIFNNNGGTQFPHGEGYSLDGESHKFTGAGDNSDNKWEVFNPTVSFPTVTRYKGNVTLNGKVTVKDATALQSYLANLSTFSKIQSQLGDLDGDNNVTIKDVTYIQYYLAGIVVSGNLCGTEVQCKE